jgi:hydroxymethylbilane synthase
VTPRELRLGTRGSQLALWQANLVAARIAESGGPSCRIVVIKTSGDRLQEAPLSDVGGKRLFVKEIEDALLRSDIDLAVHSSKDMPAVLPADLAIGAVLPREDPRDAIVLPATVRLKADSTGADFDELVAVLGRSPSIGTGSVRRIAQLSRLFPGARFTPIRGNLDTRLRKLDAGEHDALVLAAAGLRRLGFAARITLSLPAAACVPAPGQGIVAVEIREDDGETAGTLTSIDDPVARAALIAERTLVEALGGGCQTPIGALASAVDDGALHLVATVVSVDGVRAVTARGHGTMADAAALGRQVAAQLIEKGAAEILADAQRVSGAVQGIQP